MRAERPTLSHYAEYYGLRGVVAVLRLLSFQRAGAIGAWIGKLAYRPFGVRRAVVERQVRAAFPGLPDSEVERIALASYANLGRTSIETALLPEYSPAEIVAFFDHVEGWDVVERALAAGNGVLMVAGHLGNWELGGSYLGVRSGNLRAVARRMQNPIFDRYLTETRRRIGVEIIQDADAVRQVPRHVRNGGVAGFLFDQGAAGLASTWAHFFGRYAKTPRGPAVFALRLDAPLIFTCAIRQPNGRFSMYFEELPVTETGDREADVDRVVQTYTDALERWVRRYPEQYFWQHRRWKHQRPGTPPELGDPS